MKNAYANLNAMLNFVDLHLLLITVSISISMHELLCANILGYEHQWRDRDFRKTRLGQF